ncbi:MAG: hypothetical protein AAF871_03950 [Pseudomonadota bacterium]
MSSWVELRVENEFEGVLIYAFERPTDAAEMIEFLSSFWPKARFIVEPLRH